VGDTGEGVAAAESALRFWFLQFIGSATFSVALLALLGFLGRKALGEWIESRFDRSLERYKAEEAKKLQGLEHQHAEKLEGIRFELSKLTHRVQQLHEKEIEVLGEAWRRLKAAEGAVFQVVTPFSKHSDYDAMPEALLSEVVETLPFSRFHKDEILAAKEKNRTYFRLMQFKKHNDAVNATNDLGNYMLENAPFLSEELKSLFERVVGAFRSTTITDEICRQASEMGSPLTREFLEWNEVGPLIREIEQLIRQRLRYAEA